MKKTLLLLLNLSTMPACFCMDASYGAPSHEEKQRQRIEKERIGTLFLRAILKNDISTFEKLLADVDPELKAQALGDTLYCRTPYNEEYTAYFVTKLLEAGADAKQAGKGIHHQNGFGRTPLHFAVDIGSVLLVKALLEAGVDTTIPTPYDETALQLAVKKGRTEIVELLTPKP